MRKIVDTQMKLGEVDIADIRFDLRSRDEIPKLLMGLQSIYCNPDIRQQVFEVLTSIIPKNVDPNNGRWGMDLWTILVLGTLRLCCSWDYDKLHDIANNHDKLRKMLGHSEMDKDYQYALQTLKDNVSLLTPEVVDRINQIVVKYGHQILGKKIQGRFKGQLRFLCC
jgi:IS5 family transposase